MAKKQTSKVRRVVRQPMGVDKAGLEYAKLIADPCNQELTHPTYGVGPNGYLIKLRSTFSVSDSKGAVYICPSGINVTGVP